MGSKSLFPVGFFAVITVFICTEVAAAELSIDNQNAEAVKGTNGKMYKSSDRRENRFLSDNGDRCGCRNYNDDGDDDVEDCDSSCNGNDDSERCKRCEDYSDDCEDDKYHGYGKKGKNSELRDHGGKGKSIKDGVHECMHLKKWCRINAL